MRPGQRGNLVNQATLIVALANLSCGVLLACPNVLSATTVEVLAFAPISIVVPALCTWLHVRRPG